MVTDGRSVQELRWWQKAVFYQVYPRSFADSDGDGIGDIQGIIDRLDYLHDLGIDAIWLSPHYPSPLFDCGYDVSDYTGVAPEYGTLGDFRRFLDGAHERSIRVIVDLVLNHTSDEHAWFVESRSGRSNPKRDWYIWRDGRDGGPPNNWASCFGGSAWEFDPVTGQYYYHYFFKQQPDLDWRNPEVRQAMFDAARFWLDLGVDGFRLDAIGTLLEDPALRDHRSELSVAELCYARCTASSREERARVAKQQEAMFPYQKDQPGMHELMRELRAVTDEYPQRVLVGETGEIAYYGEGDDELHLVFNFPLTKTEQLTPAWVIANQRQRLGALPPKAWPCNTLGNHDCPRVCSSFGDGRNDAELARLSLALMLTLRGTPFLYNGEEIGMTDLPLTSACLFRDSMGIWFHSALIEELGVPPELALDLACRYGRDKCRTPMQWANAPNAGFSPAGVQTWLPVNPNYAQGVNVAEQIDDPDSLLTFYRRMLRVRKETPALVAGEYTPLSGGSEGHVAFLRSSEADGQSCLVVLNMENQARTLSFDLDARTARPLFSSHPRGSDTDDLSQLSIAPFEVYVAELEGEVGVKSQPSSRQGG